MNISIITVVKEDTDDLFVTWNSIFPFLSNKFKWIIKYSSICSAEFIEKMPKNNNLIKVQSSDRSLYDAINQSLEICETDYYMVIGAGDFLSSSFNEILDDLSHNQGREAYFYGCNLLRGSNNLYPDFNQINTRMSCPHPSSILKVSNSLSIGGYSSSYYIASDYEHLCNYIKNYTNLYQSNLIAVMFMGGGISDKRALEGMLEEELIRIRIFGSTPFGVYGRLLNFISIPLCRLLSNNFQ